MPLGMDSFDELYRWAATYLEGHDAASAELSDDSLSISFEGRRGEECLVLNRGDDGCWLEYLAGACAAEETFSGAFPLNPVLERLTEGIYSGIAARRGDLFLEQQLVSAGADGILEDAEKSFRAILESIVWKEIN